MVKAKTVKNIVEESKENNENVENVENVNDVENVEEAQEIAQADEEEEEAEVKAVNEVIGEELYKKYADAVKNAKQFYQCKLPSISYYSKRSLCDAVDTMKRMCDRSNGVETTNMCIELLETAIAYLYSRKVNG